MRPVYSLTRRQAPCLQRQNMLQPNNVQYVIKASHPPLAPSPYCGRPSTQPSPGAKINVCASGTNTNQDRHNAVAAGTCVSPAPRKPEADTLPLFPESVPTASDDLVAVAISA